VAGKVDDENAAMRSERVDKGCEQSAMHREAVEQHERCAGTHAVDVQRARSRARVDRNVGFTHRQQRARARA